MFMSPEEERDFKRELMGDRSQHSAILASVANLPQDQAAKILRMSMAYGTTPDDVANNMKSYQNAVVDDVDWNSLQNSHPKTSAFLNDPINMAIVRDKQNVTTLSDIENSWISWNDLKEGVKGIARAATGFAKGVVDFGTVLRSNADATYEATHTPEEVEARKNEFGRELSGVIGKKVSDTLDTLANKYLAPDEPIRYKYISQEYTHALLQQVPQYAAQLALAFLNPAASVGFIGTQIAGQDYLDNTKAGASKERAFGAALSDSAVQSALEYLPIARLLKKMPEKISRGAKVKEVAIGAGAEGITEAVQQYPQDFFALWAKSANKSQEELMKSFFSNIGQTTEDALWSGALALPFGGLGAGTKLLLHNIQERRAAGLAQNLDQQVSIIASSPLLKISPEVIEKHLDEVTDGANVFVDPEAMVLFQSENPKLAEELGVSEKQVEEALATGAMVEIPVSKYITVSAAHPEVHKALKDDIADDEEGVTIRRVNEQHNSRDIEETMQEVTNQENSIRREADKVYQQWTDAGMPKEVARSALTLLVSNAYTQGNPVEFLREKAPLVVRQKYSAVPGALHQYAGKQALTADRLRLQEAQQMETAGEDAGADGNIRKQTGWHKAGDGKWRFEIDDSKAKLFDWSGLKDMEEQAIMLYRQANRAKDPDKAAEFRAKGDEVFAEYTSKQPTNLGRVLDHPALYSAYPAIANTKIIFSDLPKDNHGAYRPAINTIELNKNLTAEEMRQTLLHEVQHVIQSYEQFAPGGNPDMFEDIDQTDHEIESLQGELDSIIDEHPESRAKIERAWEIEAKPEEERTQAEAAELDSIYEEVYNSTGEWGKRLAEKEDKIKQVAETGSVLTAFEQYQRLHGEIEARDTSSRANLTAEERLATPPDARGDAIIIHNGREYAYNPKSKTYYQAANPDVNPEQEVNVVDISNALPQEIVSNKELLSYLKSLVNENTALPTADQKAIMEIIPKDVRHIVFSSNKVAGRELAIRKGSLLSIESLIKNAVLIESIPNKKTDTKPGVSVYHRFYVPVGFRGKLYTIRLVAEEQKGVITVNPTTVNLYDAIVERVGRSIPLNQPTSQESSGLMAAPERPITITIRDMLAGVKDSQYNNYFQNGDDPKGSIHWQQDGRAIITLFEKADPSTVIHELVGHYMTQNLLDQGSLETAPEWMKKDRETVLEYVGIENWETATDDQKRAAHEKMASAAETYLLEGKSPSQALTHVFRRFVEWLTEVYHQIRRTEVNLNPEIREVFDRMLASQQEIEQMELIKDYHKRLPQEVLATLSEQQIAWLDKSLENVREKSKDILRGRVLKRFTAEQKAEIRAEIERVTPQIEEETAKEPVYLAMEELRKQSGGGNPRSVANEYLKKLTNSSQDMFFKLIAEQFGFTSADHMMKKIMDSKDWKNEVKERIDQHIQDTFGDIYERKHILYQEAEKAMFNEDGATLLAVENQILLEKLGKVLTREEQRKETIRQRETASMIAQDAIAKMPVNKAMNFKPFMTAYRRAAEKSRAATIKGDYVTAQKEKEIQLYNHAMVMESLKARREFERIGRFFSREKSAGKDTWRKEQHFIQAGALLQRIGYGRKDYDPTAKSESLSQWADRMNEVMDSVDIADWIVNENGPLEFRKLRISDIQDIENALRNIKKVAQTEDEFLVLENKQNIAETIDEAEKRLANKKNVYVPQAEEGDTEKNRGFRRGAFRSVEKITTLLGELDSWKDFGFFHELIYDRVYKQQNELSNMMHELRKAEQENTDKYYTKEEQKALWKETYYPELGISVSKRFLLEMASHTGTKTNQKALFGAVPVGLEGSSLWVKQQNSKDRIDAAISSNRVMEFLQNHLTEKDWQWVQAGWDNIHTLWPKANEMHKQQTGFSMKKVDAQPLYVTLSDGRELELRGGYYPLKEDSRARDIADKRAAQSAGLYTENMQLFMPKTSTGYTKERSNVAYSVDLNPSNRYRHMQSVAHDIAFRPVITDLRRLITNDRFRKLMERKIGPEGYAAIKDFIAAAARPETKASSVGEKTIDTVANVLRERAIIATMMFNAKTLLQNFANPLLYGRVAEGFGYGDAANAFINRGLFGYWAKGISDREAFRLEREFVFSKSAFMRDKMETPDFILHEFQNQMKGDESKIVKWGSMLLAETDNLTNIPMWREAYEKKLAAGESEENAIRFADTLIDRTTGSGRKIDTAPLLRGNSMMRLLTMYQTFMNTQLNGWIREFGITIQEKDYTRLAVAVGARFLLFTLASIYLSGDDPEKDDEKYWVEWANKILSYPMQLIPIAGSLSSTAMGYLLGAQSFGYRLSPIEGQLERISKVFGTVPAVLDGRKPPQALAEAATAAASFIRPYPDQFNRWFWNAFDMVFNDMDPARADFIRRRPKKER